MINEVVENLVSKNFEVFLTKGCFDIAAKRDKLLMIKCLTNVDGLNGEQAKNLRNISYFLSGYPFIISLRNNRTNLADSVIYSRFDLPVVTPIMFDSILEEEAYVYRASKGRYTAEIDTGLLRNKRYEMKFSLEELSVLVGVSKKALYEIENNRTNPTEDTLNGLESVLGVNLKKSYESEKAEKSDTKPVGNFQRKVHRELDRIGIENVPVKYAPFEIIGKEEFTMITGLIEDTKKIGKSAGLVKKLSEIVGSNAFFVTKKREEKTIEGVPVLLDDDLPEIETARELKKIIEETSE